MPDVILGNLPAPATTPLTGAERVPMDQLVGGTIAATALTPGLGYAIISLGTTNWTACGVPAGVTPAVGLVFTCSAVGTGTGTAQQVETVDAAASDIAALAAPTNLSYDAATRLLASSTGTDVTLPLAGPTTPGLLPPTNDALSLASLTVTGTLTAPHIHGAMAGPLYVHVRNDAGVSLPAGSTVHVVGNQGDTSVMLVILARADDPATMPANGILVETLAPNADGHAIDVGEFTGLNTSGLTAGAQVFVALTGGLTMTRPATNPQAIATVGRVHSSTGSILVNASPVLSTVAFTGAYSDLSGRPPEISQADAEAGSSTTFSLWTAQRWWQAAAAWWQTVTSAVGRSLVAAADAPAARSAISAAGSGAITASGLTIATARLLGRTTAGSGAVEEIQVSGGTFTGGILTLFDPASPGAIGGTTPASGTFTGLTLPAQATPPVAPATGFRLFADASGRVAWRRSDGWVRTFEASGITADRMWGLPDRSGTLALTEEYTAHIFGTDTENLSVGRVRLLARAWQETTQFASLPLWELVTAPSGASAVFDIRVNGTSIYSTLPSVASGSTSSTANPGVFSTAFNTANLTIASGSLVEVWCTQTGVSPNLGAGLRSQWYTRRIG